MADRLINPSPTLREYPKDGAPMPRIAEFTRSIRRSGYHIRKNPRDNLIALHTKVVAVEVIGGVGAEFLIL